MRLLRQLPSPHPGGHVALVQIHTHHVQHVANRDGRHGLPLGELEALAAACVVPYRAWIGRSRGAPGDGEGVDHVEGGDGGEEDEAGLDVLRLVPGAPPVEGDDVERRTIDPSVLVHVEINAGGVDDEKIASQPALRRSEVFAPVVQRIIAVGRSSDLLRCGHVCWLRGPHIRKPSRGFERRIAVEEHQVEHGDVDERSRLECCRQPHEAHILDNRP
mmetsp:Transcript_27010/g.86834  ORF Transcript_27010/g.86834 Transcript_27010/m.86834 type:complete len:217 (-) Transcript_27010:46-696(-)